MKILITGATGFIGKRLSERAFEKGHDLICTGRSLDKLGSLRDKVKTVYLDIEDKETTKKLIHQEKPDIVFHCAALVDNISLKRLRCTNVEGTKNLFEACLKEKIERVVYLSSTAVIAGNSEVPLTDDLPFCATNNYGQSKIEAERVALQYRDKGLKTAIIRPPMVYGEEEPHLLSLIVRLIRWRLLPIIGEGNNKLHMVDIDNVVDVMLLCLSRNEAYEGTYIVADNEVLSTKEFLGIIAEAIDVRPPLHMHKSLIPFLEHTPFLKNKVTFFTKDRVYSIERIRDRLGYNPRISIYDGLRRVALACRKKS